MPQAAKLPSSKDLVPSISFKYLSQFSSFYSIPMATIIDFVKKTFNLQEKEQRCLVLGLDASGKTTFLYRCFLGGNEEITVIPTIGFNVETLKCGSKQKDVTFWDVGGCDKIRPLIRHYFNEGMAILFILDIHDSRLDEAMEELVFQVREANSEFGVSFLGVLLNKQDRPGSTPELLQKCRDRVNDTVKSIDTDNKLNWRLFDSEGLSTSKGVGLQEVLGSVQDGLENWKSHPTRKTADKATVTATSVDKPPTKDDLYKRVQTERLAREFYNFPELILDKMRTGKYNSWDHSDHLFVAFVILQDVLKNPSNTTTPQQPVIVAVDLFLEHLTEMLQASPGRFRNTVHRTMTTFWVYQVYTALLTFDDPANRPGYTRYVDRFYLLLEQNIQLLYGGLWKEYYSKDLMFSPKAKENFVRPDIQALPSMYGMRYSTESKSFDMKHTDDANTTYRLKRWAYATLQTVKATGGRRGLIVKNALSQLHTDTIRQRVKNPHLEPHSETQAYFWIQIVHAAMEGVLKKSPTFDFSTISYDTFTILYPDAMGANDLWKEYYTESNWKGLPARVSFIPPKKGKVIPNVMVISETKQDWKSAVSDVRVPTMEELTQRANWIANYIPDEPKELENEKPALVAGGSANIPDDDLEDDEWVDILAVTKTTSEVKLSEPEPKKEKPEQIGPQSWKEHAERIHQLFNKMPKSKSHFGHTSLSKLAYKLVKEDGSQLTKSTFWVRMFVEAYAQMYTPDQIPTFDPDEQPNVGANLREFLMQNLELCWEDLWMVYYNELSWTSISANETILGSDRKPLRSLRDKSPTLQIGTYHLHLV